MSVLIETSFGDVTIDLYTQKAPNASLNFIKLCKLKHYNNALFEQVQKNYVARIKCENPTTIWTECQQNMPYFKDEIDLEAKINDVGLVVSANTGSNLNNCDFFITLTKAHLSSLDGKHTVFGKVVEGFKVLRKLNDTYVDERNRPQMNIRILHTFIVADPFPDPARMLPPPASPEIKRDSDRLEAIEHLQMLEKCQTEEEMLEATKIQKAKKQALTLQILGDLPDASVKPLETILFICKLNPITQERDLEVIFSRFGPIKSVEIVRDWKTGQSLQYGFIQFESVAACEEAFLKMDNVMIDERRIRVDFSQSVSKLMPKNRNAQLQKQTVKTDIPPKTRTLQTKIKLEGKQYYGASHYDIVTPETSRLMYKHGDQKEAEEQVPQRTGRKYQIKNKKKHQKKRRQVSDQSSSSRRRKHRSNSSSSSRERQRSRKLKRNKRRSDSSS